MAHVDVDTARVAEIILGKHGRAILYKSGAYSVNLTAARGRTPSQDAEEERFQTTSDRCRWLVKASTLILNAVETLPNEGDKIEETKGNKKFIYEVLHDGSQRHWDYFDTGREYIWIRVKEHATVTVP